MTDVTSIMLARYLADECDPYEREEIRRWIEADPDRGQMVAALRSIGRPGNRARPMLDVDAFWSGIAARMDRPALHQPVRLAVPAAPAAPIGLTPAGAKSRRWRGWVAAAAAAVVAGLVVADPRITSTVTSVATSSQRAAVREVATKRGERAQVTLADGSKVVLGPESKLQFPDDFGQSQRDVHLRGQAYFQVTHDERRPFRVRTAGSVTEDLGTEFVVRQYPSDSTAWVAVASGVVALAGAADARPTASTSRPVVLTAGFVGRVDASGRAAVDRTTSVESQLAWTAGELRFQRTPLGEVARELRRWYDLDVRLGDASLATRTITARFKDQSADAVLQSLATVLRLDIRRTGRSVTLLPD